MEQGGEDEKESALVALLADQYMQHGFDHKIPHFLRYDKSLSSEAIDRITRDAKALAERVQRARELSRPEHAAIELDRKISKVFCCLIVLFIAIFPGIIAVALCFGSVKPVMTSPIIEGILAVILFCIAYGVTAYILIKRWFAEIDREAYVENTAAVNEAYNRLMREAEEKKVESPQKNALAENQYLNALKVGVMTGGGTMIMFVLMAYNFLPLVGVVAVVTGLVGFFTGSPYAMRAFFVGLAILAVRLIVGTIFFKILGRGKK